MKRSNHYELVGVFGFLIVSIFAANGVAKPTEMEIIKQLDFNEDGVLDWVEVTAGLENRLDTAVGRKPKINLGALRKKKTVSMADLGKLDPKMEIAQATFKERFGPGPKYSITRLVADPFFSPKVFALNEEELPDQKMDTTSKWIAEDKHPLKVRRSIDDLNTAEGPDAAAKDSSTKGALVSYANNFNTKSDQWAFHGIIGLNLIEEENVHFGEEINGHRLQIDRNADAGITEYWIRPSVGLDKVNTSHSSKDEIDSLVLRLGGGFHYSGRNLTAGVLDGFNVNLTAAYATDTSSDSKVIGGALDITPVRLGSGFWDTVNDIFRPVGIFRVKPELVFHTEGGSVLDETGSAALQKTDDFLRIGGTFGLSIRATENMIAYFKPLQGLLLHAGLQYYVDVTGSGPDVDLFTASVDWALDEKSHYSLTAEYRNGRSPLLLQRDKSVVVGLGVKF
jgi:hypothetical protein